MHRVVFNDYVNATLSGLFVFVVVAIAVYGAIYIRRALGSPSVTCIEVGGMPAPAEEPLDCPISSGFGTLR